MNRFGYLLVLCLLINLSYQAAAQPQPQPQYITLRGRKYIACQRAPKNQFKCGPQHGNLYCNLRGDYCSKAGYCGPGTKYRSKENLKFSAGLCRCPHYSTDGRCGQKITCANPGEVCTPRGECQAAKGGHRRRMRGSSNPNARYAFKPCIAKP